MAALTYTLQIPVSMTRPGYWLYVWRVTIPNGDEILYVGRTGDDRYITANPPIVRMGQHFDPNGAQALLSNLRNHLLRHRLNARDYADFRIVAHGPLFPPPANDRDYHDTRLAVVRPLERALRDALQHNGYVVIGQHSRDTNLCRCCWQDVRQAFMHHFNLTNECPQHNQGPDYPCFQHA